MNTRENFLKFSQKYELGGNDVAHWEAATEADTGDEGRGQMTVDLLVRYADTAEKQATMLESIRVFKYQFDLIGQWAFEADRQAAA